MKLSEQTISILKNFSNINSGLFFQTGKQIKTVAPSKAILAHANIAEEIPVEFGIYDLNRLLGVLSLIEQPDIEFGDKQLVLKDATRSSRGQKQTYCDASLVVRPPDKEVALPLCTQVTVALQMVFITKRCQCLLTSSGGGGT